MHSCLRLVHCINDVVINGEWSLSMVNDRYQWWMIIIYGECDVNSKSDGNGNGKPSRYKHHSLRIGNLRCSWTGSNSNKAGYPINVLVAQRGNGISCDHFLVSLWWGLLLVMSLLDSSQNQARRAVLYHIIISGSLSASSTVGKQAQVCFCLSVLFDGLKRAVGVLMGSDTQSKSVRSWARSIE